MTRITVHTAPVAPLAGTLPMQCEKDLAMLRRFAQDAMGRGTLADAVSPASFREVLLTGATGLVGRFLLRDLLREDDDLVVHCLVRAEHEAHGLQRLRAALEEADLWEDRFAERLRVVVGDVCDARLGLSEGAFDDLCHRVDAVYHVAASVAITVPYLALRKVNTLSVRNVLELCLRTRLKHLFFTSSMGVFPQYFFLFGREFAGRRIDHQMQPDLEEMKRKFPVGALGYPWSKLVVEQALLSAGAAGLPVGIFRLPIAGGASTGAVRLEDIVTRVVAAVIEVGMLPQGFSMQRVHEPVDVLTRICTAISRNPQRRHTIYQCCDSRPALHELEPADFGWYWPEAPYPSFKRACQARGERSALHGQWALLDHAAPYWFGERDTSGALPVCDRAMREDCPAAIEWPGVLTVLTRLGEWVERPHDRRSYPSAESRLDFECLISQARRYADRAGVGFEQAYPPWMRQGLERLVECLRAPEVRLRKERRSLLVFELSRLLRNNAALARERREHPEIGREEVVRPVFIVGINRSGTTLLHRLMARDPRFWTLRTYECFAPAGPPREGGGVSAGAADLRRAALQDMFEAAGAVESFSGVHDFDIDEPEEDFPLLRLAFATWTTVVRFRLPDYARWLAETGARHAYAHHRRIVQRFTWERRRDSAEGSGQWLFKMPFHLRELGTLIETYPDALFIQTHRAPAEVMGSWNSLVERARSGILEPFARHEIGEEQLDFMSDMLNRATRFRIGRRELADRWIDVEYVDLVRDPLAVVRTIYNRFDWRLEPAALDRMDEWLQKQAERRRRQARHQYRLDDYGLTAERVDAAFAPYLDFITARGQSTG